MKNLFFKILILSVLLNSLNNRRSISQVSKDPEKTITNIERNSTGTIVEDIQDTDKINFFKTAVLSAGTLSYPVLKITEAYQISNFKLPNNIPVHTIAFFPENIEEIKNLYGSITKRDVDDINHAKKYINNSRIKVIKNIEEFNNYKLNNNLNNVIIIGHNIEGKYILPSGQRLAISTIENSIESTIHLSCNSTKYTNKIGVSKKLNFEEAFILDRKIKIEVSNELVDSQIAKKTSSLTFNNPVSKKPIIAKEIGIATIEFQERTKKIEYEKTLKLIYSDKLFKSDITITNKHILANEKILSGNKWNYIEIKNNIEILKDFGEKHFARPPIKTTLGQTVHTSFKNELLNQTYKRNTYSIKGISNISEAKKLSKNTNYGATFENFNKSPKNNNFTIRNPSINPNYLDEGLTKIRLSKNVPALSSLFSISLIIFEIYSVYNIEENSTPAKFPELSQKLINTDLSPREKSN